MSLIKCVYSIQNFYNFYSTSIIFIINGIYKNVPFVKMAECFKVIMIYKPKGKVKVIIYFCYLYLIPNYTLGVILICTYRFGSFRLVEGCSLFVLNLLYLDKFIIIFVFSNYGISALVEIEWNRLHIPNVLRIFWAIRVLEQTLFLVTDMESKNKTMYGAIKYLLIKGCDTFTAVLGMTSFVSYFCHYLGAFFQWVKKSMWKI